MADKKYIDADNCEKYFYEHMDDLSMKAAMNAIAEIPAADVAPVVHAEWKFVGNSTYNDYERYICTACNNRISLFVDDDIFPDELSDYPYCPQCGAKMDGGAGNNGE